MFCGVSCAKEHKEKEEANTDPADPDNNLCIRCKDSPRHFPHMYCGKTCAEAAGALSTMSQEAPDSSLTSMFKRAPHGQEHLPAGATWGDAAQLKPVKNTWSKTQNDAQNDGQNDDQNDGQNDGFFMDLAGDDDITETEVNLGGPLNPAIPLLMSKQHERPPPSIPPLIEQPALLTAAYLHNQKMRSTMQSGLRMTNSGFRHGVELCMRNHVRNGFLAMEPYINADGLLPPHYVKLLSQGFESGTLLRAVEALCLSKLAALANKRPAQCVFLGITGGKPGQNGFHPFLTNSGPKVSYFTQERPKLILKRGNGDVAIDNVHFWHELNNALHQEVQKYDQDQAVKETLEDMEVIEVVPEYIEKELRTIQGLSKQFQSGQGKDYVALREKFKTLMYKSRKIKDGSLQHKAISPFVKGLIREDCSEKDCITAWENKTFSQLHKVEKTLQTAAPSRPATKEDYDHYIGDHFHYTNPTIQDLVEEARRNQ